MVVGGNTLKTSIFMTGVSRNALVVTYSVDVSSVVNSGKTSYRSKVTVKNL